MFTYPFEILKKRAEDNISELREIDFYLQQDSTSDKTAKIFAAPGLFIEFVPIGDMQVHGNKMQSREVDINLILLTECVYDTGNKRMKKDSPQDHMRIYDKINKFFQGFGAKISYLPDFVGLLDSSQDQRIMNSLNRIDATSPHAPRKGGLMKSIQTFKTIIYDHSACKQYTIADPQPTLEVDIDLGEWGN